MLMLISPKEMPAAVLVSHDLGRYRINDFSSSSLLLLMLCFS
jgi:hypothetical protein